MASYELDSFVPNRNIRIVVAAETLLPASVRLVFLVIDPEQQIVWPTTQQIEQSHDITAQSFEMGYARRDYLWQHTCFELFVGIKNKTAYREINLSPAQAWNCYQFEQYRQPAQMPPVPAQDIQLLQLQAQPQKLEAILDLQQFLQTNECQWDDLVFGLTSVIKLKNNSELYFALNHSTAQPDFHCKRDWTASL